MQAISKKNSKTLKPWNVAAWLELAVEKVKEEHGIEASDAMERIKEEINLRQWHQSRAEREEFIKKTREEYYSRLELVKHKVAHDQACGHRHQDYPYHQNYLQHFIGGAVNCPNGDKDCGCDQFACPENDCKCPGCPDCDAFHPTTMSTVDGDNPLRGMPYGLTREYTAPSPLSPYNNPVFLVGDHDPWN